MIMCVRLCYPVSIHMSQLLSTGRPISSSKIFIKKHIYDSNFSTLSDFTGVCMLSLDVNGFIVRMSPIEQGMHHNVYKIVYFYGIK